MEFFLFYMMVPEHWALRACAWPSSSSDSSARRCLRASLSAWVNTRAWQCSTSTDAAVIGGSSGRGNASRSFWRTWLLLRSFASGNFTSYRTNNFPCEWVRPLMGMPWSSICWMSFGFVTWLTGDLIFSTRPSRCSTCNSNPVSASRRVISRVSRRSKCIRRKITNQKPRTESRIKTHSNRQMFVLIKL